MNPRPFWSSIPKGIRALLVITITVYAANKAGEIFEIFNLHNFLALNAPAFWNGSLWQLITHPFLPQSFIDLIANGCFLVVLGTRLEQDWSRNQFWSFCLISALGAGLAKILLTPHSLIPFAGMSGIIFGLMAAWLKLFGREEVLLLGFWRISVRFMVIIVTLAGLLVTSFQSGKISMDAFFPIFGGVIGWIYLTLRWKQNLTEPAQIKTSERIARLEL